MTRTRRMNADEVERILERYGFELISQKGIHRNILLNKKHNEARSL
jgi:predicted RNA binding protein YcfA (HicA-like mRNA interferase family)